MQIKIKKLNENFNIPVRATEGAAGFDLTAAISNPITINPGERIMIPCGFAMEIPDKNCAAFIFARSGLATKHGVTLSNSVGVVDSDYRGEVKAGLVNLSDAAFTIEPQSRIAQMVVMPVCPCEMLLSDALDETKRGAGGFGSTGV